MLAAALLAFALSIDDFVISDFNSGQERTFPLYVYDVALRGIPLQVNVIATMLFAVTVARHHPGDLAAAASRADGRRAARPSTSNWGGAVAPLRFEPRSIEVGPENRANWGDRA